MDTAAILAICICSEAGVCSCSAWGSCDSIWWKASVREGVWVFLYCGANQVVSVENEIRGRKRDSIVRDTGKVLQIYEREKRMKCVESE